MQAQNPTENFLMHFKVAWEAGILVKLSMGNYKGPEADLKNIYIRPVVIKNVTMLSVTYRYITKDIVKNYAFQDGEILIRKYLETGFKVATLFTESQEIQWEELANRKIVLRTRELNKPLQNDKAHDRRRKRHIAAEGKTYLHALGITNETGEVIRSSQDKYRQINHYIEILQPLISALTLPQLKVVDMGAGKGYLTFALYDYLKNTLSLDVKVTGVEYRPDLVKLCNGIAVSAGFENLHFEEGTIESYKADTIDVLIALHACNAATDDAIFKGIGTNAQLIVVAPCCHKQIRKEMEVGKPDEVFHPVLRHGIFMERQAEMVTDAMRALYLEYAGYQVKVMQFISDAHTPKNVMITGSRKKEPTNTQKAVIMTKINAIKKQFGIGYHHLGKLMGL